MKIMKKKLQKIEKFFIKLSRAEGKKKFEYAAAGIRTRVVGLEGPSNNQTIPQLHKKKVRRPGFEPGSLTWQARVLTRLD